MGKRQSTLEDLVMSGYSQPDPSFWAGKRVLLTGHTGFKGAWLAFWLDRLGAKGLVPRLFQIFVVRDGKVASIHDYGRRDEAFAAAGLSA